MELCRCVSGDSDGGGGGSGGNTELVEVALRLLANLVRVESDVVVGEKRTVERFVKIALGSERKLAKFAARFLVLTGGSSGETAARGLLEVSFPFLFSF